ncbi:MAG TPA: alpha-amylase family glycosyl hydrolase [Acidimicrobiia bacterium]|nr:alpha-amylase family glycosyl hydrolase [Acidimicrobiia bacterium]
MSWWRDGVIYQIYPRSYRDSNGDGVGDLAGIIERLDHLVWLGADAIWITPITVSPDTDWGYDVADYTAVQPVLGDLDDFDRLVAEAGARGIRVVLDLVPNHTSDQHPWFVEARAAPPDSPRRSYYVWADPKPDGSPPNNWRSSFGGPAWTRDPASGQYYLHNFLATQPDLNWWSEDVRGEFDRILRFWFDRGVAGFRIDVCHAIVKDRELRDNPPAEPGDHPYVFNFGQRKVYNAERPEAHDVFRRWRAIAEEYDPARLLLGETYVLDVERLRPFYGDGDELQLAFNFVFLHSPFTAEGLRSIVDATERVLPEEAWPVWAISTHDLPRYVDRWCGGSQQRARCALVMLLTLRGTPVLYYGDELGMGDVPVPPEQRRDPVGTGAYDAGDGRDPCRTPMPWSPGPGGGFTTPKAEPWLPLSAQAGVTVEEQRNDPDSMLVLTRDLIALRRSAADLTSGGYKALPTPDGLWAFSRGERFVVVLNLSDASGAVDIGSSGRIRIGTRRGRDGEAVAGSVEVGPCEAVVVEVD